MHPAFLLNSGRLVRLWGIHGLKLFKQPRDFGDHLIEFRSRLDYLGAVRLGTAGHLCLIDLDLQTVQQPSEQHQAAVVFGQPALLFAELKLC